MAGVIISAIARSIIYTVDDSTVDVCVCVIMYERKTRGLVPRPHRCHHGDPEMWLPGHWWLWLKKAAGFNMYVYIYMWDIIYTIIYIYIYITSRI